MKTLYAIICLTFSLLNTGCDNEDQNYYLPELEQVWMNSYEEENTSDYKIYRPATVFVFPESRYRQVFEFKKNYQCNFSVLSPVDAHYMDEGKWLVNQLTKTITVTSNTTNTVYEFEVIELTNSILKIKFNK